jgi:hypothetical protein
VIGRKRAKLAAKEQRVRDMRDFWLWEWDPMRRWTVPRIRRAARILQVNQKLGRVNTTWRSRFLYGSRTGGKW